MQQYFKDIQSNGAVKDVCDIFKKGLQAGKPTPID